MDAFVKGFLKSSLVWLTLGVTLGVAMAAHPVWTIFRVPHMHMLLLGFVTMMIYGVAYHVVPRFAGTPLYSGRAALWHLVVSNVGLVGMVAGFALRAVGSAAGTTVLALGGVLSALGAYTFAFVLWRTMDTRPAKRAQPAPAQPVVLSRG
jgi:cbb3-type cytochrome oxidase subunit 1